MLIQRISPDRIRTRVQKNETIQRILKEDAEKDINNEKKMRLLKPVLFLWLENGMIWDRKIPGNADLYSNLILPVSLQNKFYNKTILYLDRKIHSILVCLSTDSF